MKLLYIEASPRGEQSYSSQVANVFISTWKNAHPGCEVDHLNLFEHSLPVFGREGASQKMAHIARLMKSGEGLEATGEWRGVLEQIDRLKNADKVLISSAMWNFSIPYPLKHYIDLVCQPGLTFGVTPKGEYVGLLKDKKMQLILASGSGYREGFPVPEDGIKADFQSAYLQHIAAFLGFSNVPEIHIRPTQAHGPEVAQNQLEDAISKARKAAAQF